LPREGVGHRNENSSFAEHAQYDQRVQSAPIRLAGLARLARLARLLTVIALHVALPGAARLGYRHQDMLRDDAVGLGLIRGPLILFLDHHVDVL
jgi:hypothetical protein